MIASLGQQVRVRRQINIRKVQFEQVYSVFSFEWFVSFFFVCVQTRLLFVPT